MPSERLDRITNAVKGRRARERRSDKNELWIDHLCLFHDDRDKRSATWQPDTGVYYCWTESRAFNLEEVELALGVSGQESVSAAPPPGRRPPAPERESLGDPVEYFYTYPDGRLSYVRVREDYSDGSKEVKYRAPDGLWKRPQDYWPIYDETKLAKAQILVVVEGEKCVDFVNSVEDQHAGLPIRAITVGGTVDFKKRSLDLAMRIQQLAPSAILIWPDNDSPGIEAMKHIRLELERLNVPHLFVDPLRYGLGAGDDCVDYLLAGGSIAVVVNDYWPSLVSQNNGAGLNADRMKHLLNEVVMITPQSFVYSDTQTPSRVDNANLEALWFHAYAVLPPGGVIRELRARLIDKGFSTPTDVAFRLHSLDNCFWWRPQTDQPCYQVTAEEITSVADPPQTMLLVPRVIPRFSTDVDLDGDYQDFYGFCQAFMLDRVQEAIVLTWLVSAFTGRKTPILLFKGGASTGKTTLATYLCALVDPDVPTLSAQKVERDLREFVRTAQRHPALLLDNVGSVKPDVEDALSKLVTGEAAPLRVLYEDVIETIHLQRAIAVTTTTWDITKGDLASRMWPIEPRLPQNQFLDEDDIAARFDPMVPRLRGFVMKMCQTYYRKIQEFSSTTTNLRIGGRVLQTMGYDVEEVAKYVRMTRARVIAEGEPWLDAMVDLWEEIKESGPYRWTPAELCEYLRKQTSEEPTPKGLSNFIRPRQALFPNYGFHITWGREANRRFYGFRGIEQ